MKTNSQTVPPAAAEIDLDRIRYHLERMRDGRGLGRSAVVESDGFHLWRVVDAVTGDRLMCGMSSESAARDWAHGLGWRVVLGDAATLETLARLGL